MAALTEAETRALVCSSLLVVLAAFGRFVLQPPVGRVDAVGMVRAGDLDSALAVAESLHSDQERRRQPLVPGERIDINTAGESELDRLPGVGPALARRILEWRRERGHFGSLADLEHVPGLGSSKVRRVAPFINLPPSLPPPFGPRTAGGTGVGEGRAPPGSSGTRIDLNRASALELRGLPGIGPAKADAIVRWRLEKGFFEDLEELREVPGIGPATLRQLRLLVVVRP